MPTPLIARELQVTLQRAFAEATRMRHEYVTIEHLVIALSEDAKIAQALERCGANVKRLRRKLYEFLDSAMPRLPEDLELDPQQTIGVERAIHRAAEHALSSDQKIVDPPSVLVEIFGEEQSHAVYLLRREGLSQVALKRYFSHGETPEEQEEDPLDGAFDDDPDAGPRKDPLEAYTIDLVAEAAAGRIDPLIGRELELERTIHVLARRRKNNPIFVGEPGVGKTAIVEGLALRVHDGKVPTPLKGASIFSLDMGAVLAGTKFRGQFEERVKAVLKKLVEHDNAILFIDEIHTVVGAGAVHGGAMDASNLLKPVLASGKLRCIGSTTYEEYKSSFERDRALARRFQKIEIGEPSVEDTILILKGLRSRYEEHHDLKYEDDALESAAKLAAKHVNERLLPDKAIDVVDEAGALVRLREGDPRDESPPRKVRVPEVERIVAKMARIPEKTVSGSERDRLGSLETDLKAVIFGQDDAISTLVSAIKLSRSGLRDAAKPIGSFLFSGPTGVGKTELARQLARVLGVELLRFDMSEYSERHTVSRLIGAPPGYVGFDQGGLLTDAVRKHPYSVIILDEIEKAHPDLFNILLQVMDHATLTDNNGRKADFRNVILVLTTNAGAFEVSRRSVGFAGFGGDDRMEIDPSRAKSAIERTFNPEFRNRLDAWVQFRGLDRDVILRVVDKEVGLLRDVLRERKVTLNLTDRAREWLAKHGYEPAFGARPMARLVEQAIKRPLAEALLFGALRDGGTATADLPDLPDGEEKIVLTFG